jgi:hypothetical protein
MDKVFIHSQIYKDRQGRCIKNNQIKTSSARSRWTGWDLFWAWNILFENPSVWFYKFQVSVLKLATYPEMNCSAWIWSFYGDARNVCVRTGIISYTFSYLGGFCLWSVCLWAYPFRRHSEYRRSDCTGRECWFLLPGWLGVLRQTQRLLHHNSFLARVFIFTLWDTFLWNLQTSKLLLLSRRQTMMTCMGT